MLKRSNDVAELRAALAQAQARVAALEAERLALQRTDSLTGACTVAAFARCAGTQFDPQVTEVLIGQLWSARQAGKA